MLMKTPGQSLTEQLSQRLAQRIRDRLLPVGTRLPSVRETARTQGVNPSTVVAAYDQLLAWGLVEARPRRGYFVREFDRKMPVALSNKAQGAIESEAIAPRMRDPEVRSPINATALIRGMFHRISDKPQPGMGVFPADWMATTFMPAAVRKVVGSSSLQEASLSYGEPLGDASLRQALSHRLRGLAIDAAPTQIITSVGATHALDIISRTLLKPGDAVMVEEPGWAVEFARLDALGVRILPVPRGPQGPDLEVMERYCVASPTGQPPKLLVSVSVLHNPTGYCLSPGHAHRVLQLAHQHDFHLVEDDTYGHLAPPHATRLCALDGLQRTLYVGGVAKLLAPNWRVGYLAAPSGLVERLLDTKLLGTLTTPSLLEKALALCIEQGQLRRHAERMRARLEVARSRSVKLALAAGCRFAAEPAGLFGWVDTGVDTELLAQHMLDEGYLLAPGSLFHAGRTPGTLMRINFATTQEAGFWTDFQRLRDRLAR
ncbi:MAG TPA: PLP-dependent aminotransferase family protein [Burkholderiaceae bacterium]|nr:PLP-dependent aminotransferase family protein [Burkholderiaceae bacterium]